MKPTSVLIATPSRGQRSQAAALVASLPGFTVIATTADLSETFNQAEILVPDLVVIAEDFTRLEEFPVMVALFAALGTGWVLLASEGQRPPVAASLATSASALTKPPRVDLSQAPDHWKALLIAARLAPRASATAPTAAPAPRATYDRIVVIGSSTGGVDALITLLSAFPADCPPTAIVQHTGRGYCDSLVQLLRRRCRAEVVTARDGVILQQGRICLAAGVEGHLHLQPGLPPTCQIRPGQPVSGHIPSIDMLFRSALAFAPLVVGTILTGMGQDGASGLLDLRRAGATTIGQDEATSVVYGMPKAAFDRGAVQMQLPLPRIGEEILRAAASPPQSDRRPAAR